MQRPTLAQRGYDWQELTVPAELATLYETRLNALGWQSISQRAVGHGGTLKVAITLKRPKRLRADKRLQALDQEAQALLAQLAAAHEKAQNRALAAAVGTGLSSVALLAISLWCLANYSGALGFSLFILGVLGCAASYLLYGALHRRLLAASQTQTQQALEDICRKAQTLLKERKEERN